MLSMAVKEFPKVREIQPMQKRVGLWKPIPTEPCLVELPSEPNSSPRLESPKQQNSIDIPFSKNRYSKEGHHEELQQENKKKAIEFLKKQNKNKSRKLDERQKLLQKKKEYQEQVRKVNKEKLKTKKKRNISIECMNSDIKHLNKNNSIRSKSEEVKGKSYKLARRFARDRIGLKNYSDAKVDKSLNNKGFNVKTISADGDRINTTHENIRHVSEQKYERRERHEILKESKVAISVDLAAKMANNHKEILCLNQIDNSGQKNSLEGDDDTKYMKTPELNMEEKYSHKHSDNKLSAQSTEKEDNRKETTRYHSSQKKKSIRVAKEILECKKDLVKMQKKNEIRKNKF